MWGTISKQALVLSLLLVNTSVIAEAQDPATPTPNVTQEQTDLSGTYVGTFTCEEAGLTGDTTLTITGNEFTTADGKKGRIVASTTRGYTAVALQPEGAAGTFSPVISLRAKKSGKRLTLSPVSGSTTKCSFVPTRTRTRRSTTEASATPAPVGTPVSSPAEVGPSPDVAKPAPRPGKTKPAKAAPPTAPAPDSSAAPSQMPMPQPVPVPMQTPRPSPTPGPDPVPSPSPSPSPEASPSPTGSPSPSASPTPSPSPSPKPPVRS
jgi:hypothetical protein